MPADSSPSDGSTDDGEQSVTWSQYLYILSGCGAGNSALQIK